MLIVSLSTSFILNYSSYLSGYCEQTITFFKNKEHFLCSQNNVFGVFYKKVKWICIAVSHLMCRYKRQFKIDWYEYPK